MVLVQILGAGWVYKGDNGLAISSNIVSKGKTTTKVGGSYIETGILTEESKTSWATQVGLTKDQWSVSGIVNLKYNDWGDEYYSTATGDVIFIAPVIVLKVYYS